MQRKWAALTSCLSVKNNLVLFMNALFLSCSCTALISSSDLFSSLFLLQNFIFSMVLLDSLHISRLVFFPLTSTLVHHLSCYLFSFSFSLCRALVLSPQAGSGYAVILGIHSVIFSPPTLNKSKAKDRMYYI